MDPIKDKPEKMKEFFDVRADDYDNHMAEYVDDYQGFYSSIAKDINATDNQIKILDLGCGTGLELEYIFKKAPNALMTGIDLSQEMLDLLVEKYKHKKGQINVIKGSYLDLDLQIRKYDYIISVMSLHHFLPGIKLGLYKKIQAALKPEGRYIEGDYLVSEKKEAEMLSDYKEELEKNKILKNELFHLDIPFSTKTEKELFNQAGFSDFKLIFKGNESGVYSVMK
ncbi:MAG: class I SAM-dependent methyltransferase [Halarsenatibacteraceae bacterium]